MVALTLGLASLGALHAETYKLRCEVEGRFAEPVPKIAPARVMVELQVIGRNLYFHVAGPSHYEMRASTLVTDEYQGENLTSGNQIGAKRMHRRSQRESEIVIERGSMELSAHNDVSLSGKTARFKYTGKCRPA
jgi:hypothetical protein